MSKEETPQVENKNEDDKLIEGEKKEKSKINEREANRAMILEVELDEESAYSHIYLTSVFHHEIDEVKTRLQNKYLEIDREVKTEAGGQQEANPEKDEEDFKEDFDRLELEQKEYHEQEELQEAGIEIKEQNLFIYAVGVASLSCIIQLAFIYTIVREYWGLPHLPSNDIELITIRVLAMVTFGLYCWIELTNGKKIVTHALYHSYLYRDNKRRFVTLFYGCIQCFTALSCFFCAGEFIALTESVSDCLMNYTGLTIITDIDNWIGCYFIGTNKQFSVYSNDKVSQFLVIRKSKYFDYTLGDLFIDIITLVSAVCSVIPVWRSLVIKGAKH